MSQSRQLAAIMFTDIVGYTALMGKDSKKALELVRISKEIQKPLVKKHNGKWLKEMGDGAMAQFSTALDAVNCSVEIQRASRADFDGKLRIGIHLGDITIDNDDVYGDGVNIASRLESIADPGGIYISEAIEKAIRGQSDVQAKYLGEIKLKNVDYGVRTYAVQGVGLPLPEVIEEKELSGHFLAEVQRRGIIRTAVSYLVVALLLSLLWNQIQFWGLTLPPWSSNLLWIILGAGFPAALYLAWNYERSPDGFVKTTSQKSWRNPYSANQRKPLTGNFIISGLLLVILIMFIYPRFQSKHQKQTTSQSEQEVSVIIDKSIAVLPFVNMSNDPEQEYFSDGMSEEIINALAQIPNLKVASRTSSFQFRGQDQDIKSIAKTLGVATILEGSVRKSKNRVRVTAQLINAADGFHLWSQIYERELDDIFAIQDELSRSIVNALQMQISESIGPLVTERTTSMAAYNLYLQGNYFLNKRSRESLERSIEYFHKAIAMDPLYALAYGGLAVSYNNLGGWGFIEPSIAFPKAKEAALKALDIDNSIGLVHAALGDQQMFYEWDWKAAEESFKLAIGLDPNYSDGRVWYWILLSIMDDFEKAETQINKAIELDPLSLVVNFNLARHYLHQGNYPKALEQALKTLEMDGTFAPAHWTLFDIYYAMGENNLAFEYFKKWRTSHNEDPDLLQAGYDQGGWAGAAKLMIPLLQSKSTYVPSSTFAQYYIHLGNNEKALDYLESGYNQRDSDLIQMRLDAIYKPLHSNPRFQALIEKMGLPPVEG